MQLMQQYEAVKSMLLNGYMKGSQCLRVCVRMFVCVCMIVFSPWLLGHWLRLKWQLLLGGKRNQPQTAFHGANEHPTRTPVR